jgi:hypothetical protein
MHLMETMKLRIYFGALFIIVQAVVFCVVGWAESFKDSNELNKWITNYYEHPSPTKFRDALTYSVQPLNFSDQKLCSEVSLADLVNLCSKVPLAYFLGTVSREAHDSTSIVLDLTHKYTANSEVKNFLLQVLILSDTEPARLALSKFQPSEIQAATTSLPSGIEGKLWDWRTDPITSPEQLGILWHVFYATGNEVAVKRVFLAFQMLRDGKTVAESNVGALAIYSTRAHIRQHPKIHAIAVSESKHLSGPAGFELIEILKAFDKEREKGA